MWIKIRKIILIVLILSFGAGVGFFVFKTEPRFNKNFENQKEFFKKYPFMFGLDLSGGSHLVYSADVSNIETGSVKDSLNSLREIIERRLNVFGVSEPIVQVQHSNFLTAAAENKLIIDLPGVTDVNRAVEMIGQTPMLEFRIESPFNTKPDNKDAKEDPEEQIQIQFLPTGLTGRYLKKASINFDQTTRRPIISIKFDDEGGKLFGQITESGVGRRLAIYLDGFPISAPVIREKIESGEASISGDFKLKEAKTLVDRLNSGALPVPITLVSKQTIGSSLGENAINSSFRAGLISFLIISMFLILFYRLLGVMAVISLSIFVVIVLSIFKIIPVTLTVSGLAGFIISIGVVVDANILMFERIKEELRAGRNISDAINIGCSRAWSSVRDSNISSILVALILFYFSVSLIQGFALVLGIGIIVSMFTCVKITRILLSVFDFFKDGKFIKFLLCK